MVISFNSNDFLNRDVIYIDTPGGNFKDIKGTIIAVSEEDNKLMLYIENEDGFINKREFSSIRFQ